MAASAERERSRCRSWCSGPRGAQPRPDPRWSTRPREAHLPEVRPSAAVRGDAGPGGGRGGRVTRLRRCGCWTAAPVSAPSVPREFREARWSSWRQTAENRHAPAAAQVFLRGGGDSSDLLLCGPVGTAETRLACTVLNESWWSGGRSMAFARDASNSTNGRVSFPSTSASRRVCWRCARCRVGIRGTFAGTSA